MSGADDPTASPGVAEPSVPVGNRMTAVGRVVRRIAAYSIAAVTVIAALNGTVGYLVFSNAADSPVSDVDAVVVLGGEHDGREAYGMTVARQRHASALVLSNPYPPSDRIMTRMCQRPNGTVDVICPRPEPSTTCGEATVTRTLATQRRWKSIVIVSWRHHLPRADLIFHQTLSGTGISVAVKAVPRRYNLPIWYWQYMYLYQFAGIAKAAIAHHC